MIGPKSTLAARRYLPEHLAQLADFLRRSVAASELMTVDQTEETRAQVRQVAREPTWKADLAFADRTSARFQRLIRRLAESHRSQVLIWTPLSNLCGLLRPVELETINFEFRFDTIVEGIVVILGADFKNEMLLDYHEDDRFGRRLCVEVSGAAWGRLAY